MKAVSARQDEIWTRFKANAALIRRHGALAYALLQTHLNTATALFHSNSDCNNKTNAIFPHEIHAATKIHKRTVKILHLKIIIKIVKFTNPIKQL